MRAVVRDLAAALGVERRGVQLDEHDAVAEILDGAGDRLDVERRGSPTNSVAKPASRANAASRSGSAAPVRRAARASAVALLLHERREPGLVEPEARLVRQLGRQLDREAVGVVQHEGVGRRDRGATLGTRALDDVVEQRRARLERRVEALLLGLEQTPHVVAMLDERRMERAELLDDEILQAAEERALEADPRAVLHRPADDPPQDVAAALVRRDDAVGGEHRHRAAVVGQHAQAPSARRPRSCSARPSSPRRPR